VILLSLNILYHIFGFCTINLFYWVFVIDSFYLLGFYALWKSVWIYYTDIFDDVHTNKYIYCRMSINKTYRCFLPRISIFVHTILLIIIEFQYVLLIAFLFHMVRVDFDYPTNIFEYSYIDIFIHLYIRIFIHQYIHSSVYTNIHIGSYSYIYIFEYSFIDIFIHLYIRILL